MKASFDLRLDAIPVAHGTGYVVRDDLLRGGTKQRAILPFVENLMRQGCTEFVYASPFSGFAQVALASAIEETKMACTIFAELAPNGKRHAFTDLAASMGAHIVESSSLQDAESASAAYAAGARYKIPLGFNDPSFRAYLRNEIEILWDRLPPTDNLWLPVGSGTLATVFRSIVPQRTRIHCVDVHVLKPDDSRIQTLREWPNTLYHSVEWNFHDPCPAACPVPSNSYYDRKVYELFSKHAQDGDVWWNVAQ